MESRMDSFAAPQKSPLQQADLEADSPTSHLNQKDISELEASLVAGESVIIPLAANSSYAPLEGGPRANALLAALEEARVKGLLTPLFAMNLYEGILVPLQSAAWMGLLMVQFRDELDAWVCLGLEDPFQANGPGGSVTVAIVPGATPLVAVVSVGDLGEFEADSPQWIPLGMYLQGSSLKHCGVGFAGAQVRALSEGCTQFVNLAIPSGKQVAGGEKQEGEGTKESSGSDKEAEEVPGGGQGLSKEGFPSKVLKAVSGETKYGPPAKPIQNMRAVVKIWVEIDYEPVLKLGDGEVRVPIEVQTCITLYEAVEGEGAPRALIWGSGSVNPSFLATYVGVDTAEAGYFPTRLRFEVAGGLGNSGKRIMELGQDLSFLSQLGIADPVKQAALRDELSKFANQRGPMLTEAHLVNIGKEVETIDKEEEESREDEKKRKAVLRVPNISVGETTVGSPAEWSQETGPSTRNAGKSHVSQSSAASKGGGFEVFEYCDAHCFGFTGVLAKIADACGKGMVSYEVGKLAEIIVRKGALNTVLMETGLSRALRFEVEGAAHFGPIHSRKEVLLSVEFEVELSKEVAAIVEKAEGKLGKLTRLAKVQHGGSSVPYKTGGIAVESLAEDHLLAFAVKFNSDLSSYLGVKGGEIFLNEDERGLPPARLVSCDLKGRSPCKLRRAPGAPVTLEGEAKKVLMNEMKKAGERQSGTGPNPR